MIYFMNVSLYFIHPVLRLVQVIEPLFEVTHTLSTKSDVTLPSCALNVNKHKASSNRKTCKDTIIYIVRHEWENNKVKITFALLLFLQHFREFRQSDWFLPVSIWHDIHVDGRRTWIGGEHAHALGLAWLIRVRVNNFLIESNSLITIMFYSSIK